MTYPHRISIAPMLDWTDRHDRFFLRLISKHALLYTEMITTGALLHGDRARFLAYSQEEHPVAIQLGGSNPGALAACARMAEEAGYDEINLNVGCPSDRVRNGRFGACLMAEPELVAACVAAMKAAVKVPVTVKTRIGIDDKDSFEELVAFVDCQVKAGVDALIVHARKAWLSGLSPKENREIPPLKYDVVYALKERFPQLPMTLNGGVKTLDEAAAHLRRVDGVMIGREAYQNPYVLADVDARFYGDARPAPTRREVMDALRPYLDAQMAQGARMSAVTRHILGLYAGLPGGRLFRRVLSEQVHRPGAGTHLLDEAVAQVERELSRCGAAS